jgi:molybdate transport system substrate-binding protein
MIFRLARICLCAAIFLIAPLKGAEVQVYAAASLSDALTDIAALFQKGAGVKIVFNFAASSVLERQIREGAPADLFFSADEAKMDHLNEMLEPGTRRSLLSNRLVVVIPAEESKSVNNCEDLLACKRIALAETTTVPAGIYARSYLEKKGVWGQLKDRVIPMENVRGVLAAVEAGNVDAGMVYRSDAAISRKVKIGFEVSSEEGPKISYPVALLRESGHKESARQFLEFLQSEQAAKIFEQHRFIVLK